MNWRELLAEPKAGIPVCNIYKTYGNPPRKGEGKDFVDCVDTVGVSRPLELPALGSDPVIMFTREYQRIATRISRVMNTDRDRGYLAWARQNQPELWRLMEGARAASCHGDSVPSADNWTHFK